MTERTILLLDDEENILSSLVRLLRRDGYHILKTTSPEEAMQLLRDHEVGVIISDQRMPIVTGVDFLGQIKSLYPDTIRMILSGYTEFKSIIDAINQGSVYKFLTKPWDDDLLRANVQEAFERFEMAQQNKYLTQALKAANESLQQYNQELVHHVDEKSHQASFNLHVLQMSQGILEQLPVGIIGIDDNGLITVTNQRARAWLGHAELAGQMADMVLPDALWQCAHQTNPQEIANTIRLADGATLRLYCTRFGSPATAGGRIITLIPA